MRGVSARNTRQKEIRLGPKDGVKANRGIIRLKKKLGAGPKKKKRL